MRAVLIVMVSLTCAIWGCSSESANPDSAADSGRSGAPKTAPQIGAAEDNSQKAEAAGDADSDNQVPELAAANTDNHDASCLCGAKLLVDSESVTASAFESKAHGGWGDFPPQLTLDGDTAANSSWRAESTDPDNPQWIQYDLGELCTLRAVQLAFVKGDSRSYFFRIEISADGENWTQVFDGKSSGTTDDLEEFFKGTQTARYVRVVGLGNTNEKFPKWINITETLIWWEPLQ